MMAALVWPNIQSDSKNIYLLLNLLLVSVLIHPPRVLTYILHAESKKKCSSIFFFKSHKLVEGLRVVIFQGAGYTFHNKPPLESFNTCFHLVLLAYVLVLWPLGSCL